MMDAECLVGGGVRKYLFQLVPSFPHSLSRWRAQPSFCSPSLPTSLVWALMPGFCIICPPSSVTCVLLTLQLLQTIPVGVGQVYGCDNPWTGGVILVALFISSPLICLHAAIGSIVGLLAGKTEPRFCREISRVVTLAHFPQHTATIPDLSSLEFKHCRG